MPFQSESGGGRCWNGTVRTRNIDTAASVLPGVYNLHNFEIILINISKVIRAAKFNETFVSTSAIFFLGNIFSNMVILIKSFEKTIRSAVIEKFIYSVTKTNASLT